MNALKDIRREAVTIIEDLAKKQLAIMDKKIEKFTEWMNINFPDVEFENFRKKYYISLYIANEIMGYNLDHEAVKKEAGEPGSWRSPNYGRLVNLESQNREFYRMSKEYMMILSPRDWKPRFIEDFIDFNMVKLDRALNKHLTNDMTANNIKVNIGGDGAEVTADVDGKLFKTFGHLAGGWVQRLHYRYRSSLK